MSMNIHFFGNREAFFKVKGKKKEFTDSISFSVFQTPSKVSYEISESGDVMSQINAYKEWVLSLKIKDEIVPVFTSHEEYIDFALGDTVIDPKVQTTKVYNAGVEHIEKLQEWLQMCEDEGYSISVEVL